MKETRLGEFEEILLLLVGILDDESYTLRITQEFKTQTGRTLSLGSTHSTLKRLEDKGFLDSYLGEPSKIRGGRRKRIFTITAFGVRALEESKSLRLALWRRFPGFSIQ